MLLPLSKDGGLKMYYFITKQGVIAGRTKKECEMNAKIKGKVDYDEMMALGGDYVVKLTDADIDFIQDKRKLSQIMFSNFFKKDNSAKVLCFLNLFLTFLLFITINNVNKGVEQIINVLSTAVGG